MVNVMVFAPSPDLMEPMQKLAQEYAGDEVNIDVIHRRRSFGSWTGTT